MSSLDIDDIFTLVEERSGVVLLPHVKSILKKVGISSLVGLSKLEDDNNLSKIEETVKNVLTNERRLEKMSAQEKIDLFGEMFFDFPKEFQFLPGERIEILAAAKGAKVILEQRKKRGGLDSGKNKSFEEFLRRWFENTTFNLNCSFTDFEVSTEKNEVTCKLCDSKTFPVTVGKNNNWVPTSLKNHIKDFHLKPEKNNNNLINEGKDGRNTDGNNNQAIEKTPEVLDAVNQADMSNKSGDVDHNEGADQDVISIQNDGNVEVIVHDCSAADVMNFTPEAENQDASLSSTVRQVKLATPSIAENGRVNIHPVESHSGTIQNPGTSNTSAPMVAIHPFGYDVALNNAPVQPDKQTEDNEDERTIEQVEEQVDHNNGQSAEASTVKGKKRNRQQKEQPTQGLRHSIRMQEQEKAKQVAKRGRPPKSKKSKLDSVPTEEHDGSFTSASIPVHPISLLARMNMKFEVNKNRHPNGYRHEDEVLNKFAMTSRILAGRQHYEWMCANFPGIFPSISTIEEKINRYSDYDKNSKEGDINIETLSNYLDSNKLPRVVLIAADATATVGRREYCPRTNALTGFSLPLKSDGLPDSTLASATSVETMIRAFRNLPRASQEMVLMAQPFREQGKPDPPAFRICSYGTDNRFTFENSQSRLQTIIKKMKEYNIDVVAYATDGDSRELKLMTWMLNLGKSESPSLIRSDDSRLALRKLWPWYSADMVQEVHPFQDPIHIATKLRVRFLKRHLFLVFGDFLVTPVHVEAMKNVVDKTRHLLREWDLNLSDKMNFSAMQRLCKQSTRELMQTHVPGSQGTFYFLQLADYITSSFLDKSLPPLERIYRIWFAVFYLRFWRAWIKSSSSYTLGRNFISRNAYLCVEINAHSLIQILLNLFDKGLTHLFKPWRYGSQSCEEFFRTARAFSPTGLTQVNFAAFDFRENRCKKIDALNRLKSEGKEDGIEFPRLDKEWVLAAKEPIHSFPTTRSELLSVIKEAVERARIDALSVLETLGMNVENRHGLFDDDVICEESNARRNGRRTSRKNSQAEIDDDDVNDSDDEEEEEIERDFEVLSALSLADLKDFSQSVSNTSQFIEIKGKDDVAKVVKKSSVVWYLENSVQKVSSDRTYRVRQQTGSLAHTSRNITRVGKETIMPGDWCVFGREDGNGYLVGHVVLLSYLDGRKESVYNWSYNGEISGETVGALCNWYSLEIGTGYLRSVRGIIHGFHPCVYYVNSIPPPSYIPSNNGKQILTVPQTILRSL